MTIEKLKQVFVDFWYLVSPIFGFLGGLFDKLEVEFLQKIFYLLSIYCLWLGIREFKRKKKNTLKQPMKPQAQRTVEQSLDPEQQIKTLVEKEKRIMKGLKIMFKWLKNNSGAVVFILTSIATVCGWLIPQVGDLWIIGDYKVLPLLLTVVTTLVGARTMPLTKSSTQELINNALEGVKGSKATPEEKERAKDIKYFRNEIKELEKQLSILEKNNVKVVEEFNRANKYGLAISHDLRKAYDEYVTIKSSSEIAKRQLEEKLALLEK